MERQPEEIKQGTASRSTHRWARIRIQRHRVVEDHVGFYNDAADETSRGDTERTSPDHAAETRCEPSLIDSVRATCITNNGWRPSEKKRVILANPDADLIPSSQGGHRQRTPALGTVAETLKGCGRQIEVHDQPRRWRLGTKDEGFSDRGDCGTQGHRYQDDPYCRQSPAVDGAHCLPCLTCSCLSARANSSCPIESLWPVRSARRTEGEVTG